MSLLRVEGLSVAFGGPRVVEEVGFSLEAGGTLGIVGESGSGKSVSVLAVMRLLEKPTVSGRATFEGRDLLTLEEAALTDLRGNRISMVFQDPMASLNPSLRVGEQIGEPLRLHRGLSAKAALARAIELLTSVGVPAAEERARAYPHQLSGGLRQRVMIAMALACEPALLIADEPTTALDVTVQAQVVELLARLQRERGMGLVLISHDLGLVAEVCSQLVVMYAGQVVERGPTEQLLRAPAHPYTAGLLASTPSLGESTGRLVEIPGVVPDLRTLPSGCRFADRCAHVQPKCRVEAVPWTVTGGERGHRCLAPLSGGAR